MKINNFESVIKIVKNSECSIDQLIIHEALTNFYKLNLNQRIYLKGIIFKLYKK
jgi:hypothetical protein